MARRKNFGILGLAICATAVSLMMPWAFHIGGRFTPLYWSGTGMLLTKSGSHPLYVLFYPTMQRANGLDGWGALCTSRDTVVPLTIDGGFNGGLWSWSCNDASMNLALFEPLGAHDTILHPADRGGFDLVGTWHGQELVMAENGNHSTQFLSGFKVEHASVILKWSNKADFNAACSKLPGASSGR